MEGMAFELSGHTAFFKKPDVNEYAYFTYSQIHKIALLGILGSVLGLGGYWQQYQSLKTHGESIENTFPEFYKSLHALNTAIVPHGDRGYFSKKIQVFNNGVGYASQENGGNLIVKEQWLENPHWTIYLSKGEVSDGMYDKLAHFLIEHQSVFIPYLGKNDHLATISCVRSVHFEEAVMIEGVDSLFPVADVTFARRGTVDNVSAPFFFSEWMPVGLSEATNHYILRELAYTNKKLKNVNENIQIYRGEAKNLCFI
ncbi:MAG: type I-B CRISPR-associated protein Cas5b [Sporolactobacillus sp.]